jgi:hypothetical protein
MKKFLTVAYILITGYTNARTLRVLFLGNSYTGVNNLPQLVSDVALSAGDTVLFSSNTPGGYTLDQHYVDSTSMGLIQQGNWDYIVLQEQSQLPSFQDYISGGPPGLSHEFNKYNHCGRVMFYMTWGRKNGDASNCSVWPPVCTYEGMDSLLSLRYFEMAQVNKAELSPVGRVWHRIRDNYPNINLYQADESHPSAEGSYAAACCFYAALFKSDPTIITFDYSLTQSDAATIRQVAKEIVYDSLANYSFIENNPHSYFRYVVPANHDVQFYYAGAGVENYLMEFGDGDTSTALNPAHIYAADGQYQVVLHSMSCDLDSIYETTFTDSVSFCNYSVTVFPDTVTLCPASSDTLFTQTYDTYQWIAGYGDSIQGATANSFIPPFGDEFSVIVSLNGCFEMSPSSVVESYITNLEIYNIDTTAFPDTACTGDTLIMVVYPNKPDPPYYVNQWLRDGQPLTFTGDTLLITSSGTYQVLVRNQKCSDYVIYTSDTIPVNFMNCNINVEEPPNDLLQIYPQPVKDILFIKTNNMVAGDYYILDIFGRKLTCGTIKNELQIDLSGFPPGSYYFRCENFSKKILKL